MTKEKLVSIFKQYSATLEPFQLTQLQDLDYYSYKNELSVEERAGHVRWMCNEAQKLVDEGRIEKAMRWLGFIQGFMWEHGIKSLDDLKEDSRPRDEQGKST